MSETKYGPWKIGLWDDIDAANRREITPLDDDTYAYREVIEPKRETVVRYARFFDDTKNIVISAVGQRFSDNIRLHIPLVDGEIEDGAMIRVERL